MPSKKGRKIAIVGASGTIGAPTLAALLAQGIHTITAITRSESNSTFPNGVQIQKGSCTDESFLVSALRGQDVLVLMLGHGGIEQQTPLIRAAGKAGVAYALPVEYSSDPEATDLVAASPFLGFRKHFRLLAEEVGVSWICIANNPWIDWSLAAGFWKIDIKGRRATLLWGGNTKFVTTTLDATAKGIASVLSLPEAELAEYKNKSVYLMSFRTTQREILESVLRATQTTEADWAIESVGGDQLVAGGKEAMAKHDIPLATAGHYAAHMKEGMGGDYIAKVDDMKKLGVEPENMEEVVKRVVEEVLRPEGSGST